MNFSFLLISGTKGGLNLRAFPDNNVEKEEGDRDAASKTKVNYPELDLLVDDETELQQDLQVESYQAEVKHCL